MKIVHVNKFFYRRGGAERYFFDVMKLLEGAGHEVIPFSMEHPENEQSPFAKYFVSNVNYADIGIANVIKNAVRALYSLEAQKKFDQLLADTKPDVIHLHNIYHQISPSILAPAERRGIPVVQTLHDYQYVCPNYTLYTPKSSLPETRFACFINSLAHPTLLRSRSASFFAGAAFVVQHALVMQERGVDTFICPSSFQRDLMIRWGEPAEKFAHLPNPIEVPPYTVGMRGEYVYYAGRFVEEKGMRLLMDAAAKLPTVPFVVQGTGPMESYVKRRAAQLSNVTFLPHTKSPKELMARMANARIVVLPSVWEEVYPYTLLEAQAQGRPIVASARGGIPEIVEDGISGVLFDPSKPHALAGAIEGVWDDEERLHAFGKAGYERVQSENDPAQHLSRLLEVYGEVKGR
ncbi:MAG: glycosyltransferase family 4 protein [bacterium]|nr:glycosyltransferase family 4 protein [bacterium]